MNAPRTPVDRAWLLLVGATAVTWWLGDRATGPLGVAATALVMGLSLGKAVVIALDFMELRHAPRLWRRFVIGWVWAVVALIVAVRATVPPG